MLRRISLITLLVIPLAVSEGYAKTSDWQNAIIKVAEKVKPSLVSIKVLEKKTEGPVKQFEFRWPSEEGQKIPEELKKWFKGFKIPSPREGMGSGFVCKVDRDKIYILTNLHVIKNARKIEIRLSDGQTFRGEDVKIVGEDKPSDLAILRVKSGNPPPSLSFADSDELKIGQWVVAAGNPFGLNGSFTFGIVSAIGRSGVPLPYGPEYQEFIQTDASINPGNSGGPLVDLNGNVIGVSTAIRSPNGGSIGIGFAIPSNTAKFVMNSLIENGKVERGFLGVSIQDIGTDLREAMGLTSTKGALVTKVLKDAPAEKAGIKEGDVILSFNGKTVKNSSHLKNLVAMVSPGTKVGVSIWRDGQTKAVKVRLGKRPEELAGWEGKTGEGNWLGMQVEETDSGVVVKDVYSGSEASDAGLREGDLIKKIGEVSINNMGDFERAKQLYVHSVKPIVFVIKRRGARFYLAIRPSSK